MLEPIIIEATSDTPRVELNKEKGIFSREAAEHFRKTLLSRGGSVDADILYRDFRGRDPEPDALLVKLGLR